MSSQFLWENTNRLFAPGTHAILGASTYSRWWNKTPEEVGQYYRNMKAVERGTKLHEMAADDIRMNMLRPRNGQTYNRYVNDAINFGMKPEMGLYYSPFAFGTTDAIIFENGKLRIHDLKTGLISKPSMHQLETYAAYFFMQYGTKYGFKPADIDMELRLYWNDGIIKEKPNPTDIENVINKLTAASGYLEKVSEEYVV